jgi:hypothetical protein
MSFRRLASALITAGLLPAQTPPFSLLDTAFEKYWAADSRARAARAAEEIVRTNWR